ncbi:glycosyl transferase family 2 [Winogradskyella pacifica]|uniref:Glycosyl transferase family 2 n=1 Tax=Winogradskyella pacifica TaxID=664642 RepID=A0A3D9N3T4_9FLAO|nr:glycosyltransferase family 2 protein [Winogradskyella pacifica]REE27448.1 glycosyl transferase family 2 [Winogradskyella pacifica]
MSLVSVIIPCYNAMPYLKDTLNSILEQSYKAIEIIVIDDGSSDGSFEYLESLNMPNLIYAKNIRKGACSARNYGFELSTGEYIQYLDADDVLGPNKINAQLKLAAVHGNESLYSCQWFHFKDSIENAIMKTQYIDKDYSEPYQWLIDSWLGKGMGQTSVWLTHRNIITKTGGWDESLRINQDGEFFSRVMFNVKEIIFSKDAFVYYRMGNASSISQLNKHSNIKAESLLKSYILYKNHAVTFNAIESVKEGLANNFLTYIYRYYNHFPELVKQAENEFTNLGYKKMWPVGGKRFRQLANIIGFKSALLLKKNYSR